MSNNTAKVKFIFANYGGKSDIINVNPNAQISDIKNNTLVEFIVSQNYTERDKIGKIRLFNLGTELKDDQTLDIAKKIDSGDEGFISIIHVHVNSEQQKQKSRTTSETKKENNCICAIF